MIFGLSLFQLFLVVLVIALAIVVAEQIRKHGLDPFLAMCKQKFLSAETAAVNEFEHVLGHAKATSAAVPPGSTVEASTGTSKVSITTAVPPVPDKLPAPYPIDPVQAVKRYIAGGMTSAQGMPDLFELQWILNVLSKSAQYAWGVAVAQAFDDQLPKPTDPSINRLNATLGDIGGPLPNVPGIRVEAQVYLAEVGGSFPIVGTTNWTKS